MSKVFIEEESLTAIGNAIRTKTGDTAPLSVPSGMVNAINSITTGGGSGSGGGADMKEITVTAKDDLKAGKVCSLMNTDVEITDSILLMKATTELTKGTHCVWLSNDGTYDYYCVVASGNTSSSNSTTYPYQCTYNYYVNVYKVASDDTITQINSSWKIKNSEFGYSYVNYIKNVVKLSDTEVAIFTVADSKTYGGIDIVKINADYSITINPQMTYKSQFYLGDGCTFGVCVNPVHKYAINGIPLTTFAFQGGKKFYIGACNGKGDVNFQTASKDNLTGYGADTVCLATHEELGTGNIYAHVDAAGATIKVDIYKDTDFGSTITRELSAANIASTQISTSVRSTYATRIDSHHIMIKTANGTKGNMKNITKVNNMHFMWLVEFSDDYKAVNKIIEVNSLPNSPFGWAAYSPYVYCKAIKGNNKLLMATPYRVFVIDVDWENGSYEVSHSVETGFTRGAAVAGTTVPTGFYEMNNSVILWTGGGSASSCDPVYFIIEWTEDGKVGIRNRNYQNSAIYHHTNVQGYVSYAQAFYSGATEQTSKGAGTVAHKLDAVSKVTGKYLCLIQNKESSTSDLYGQVVYFKDNLNLAVDDTKGAQLIIPKEDIPAGGTGQAYII